MSKLTAIQCPKIDAHEGISHGFFTRQGGMSNGIYSGLNTGLGSRDNKENVRKNRKMIVAHLHGNDVDFASPYQIHSAQALIAEHHWMDERPKGDAVICSTPDLPIAILTADCGPVLFVEPETKIIAAAHAGWRGATGGILEATIEGMIKLGAKRENIIATLGPTISQENYEVGPEFIDELLSLNQKNDTYIKPSPKTNHGQFDLPGYIVERLQGNDVTGSWTGQCTYKDEENFYSYRRTTHRAEPDYGRQASAIMIRS